MEIYIVRNLNTDGIDSFWSTSALAENRVSELEKTRGNTDYDYEPIEVNDNWHFKLDG